MARRGTFMPSPEQPGHHRSNEQRETEPTAYYRVAKYRNEPLAGRAYFRAQHIIYETQADLSVFRFQLSQIYHVALIGEEPPPELNRRIERLLSGGETVQLDANILDMLRQRRTEAIKIGPWVEGHFRPGKKL